jgi:hypothetical protein
MVETGQRPLSSCIELHCTFNLVQKNKNLMFQIQIKAQYTQEYVLELKKRTSLKSNSKQLVFERNYH